MKRINHGLCIGGKPLEYHIWRSMKKRCDNPKDKNYALYGGRGIKVCDRWSNNFAFFLKDMGPKPRGMSIERINGALGYSPDNCVWATMKQQNNNKSNNRILTFNGQSMNVSQWADKLGVNSQMLVTRLYRKWSVERTLTYGIR